jgi:hypothetical protein
MEKKGPISSALLAVCLATAATPLMAASSGTTCVTAMGREVALLPANAAPRQAAVKDVVTDASPVRTGANSRTELTFADRTIVRLGVRTALSLNGGGGSLALSGGAILFQAPWNAHIATLRAGELAVAIPGTTGVLEYNPKFFKFLILQGTGRLYRPDHLGDSVLLSAGQMVFGSPSSALTDPVDFDIARFLKTSRFIAGFRPLGSGSLIAEASRKQNQERTSKILIDTNLVIRGGGTLITVVDSPKADAANRGASALLASKSVSNSR